MFPGLLWEAWVTSKAEKLRMERETYWNIICQILPNCWPWLWLKQCFNLSAAQHIHLEQIPVDMACTVFCVLSIPPTLLMAASGDVSRKQLQWAEAAGSECSRLWASCTHGMNFPGFESDGQVSIMSSILSQLSSKHFGKLLWKWPTWVRNKLESWIKSRCQIIICSYNVK